MNYKLSIVSNNSNLLLAYCNYLKSVCTKFNIRFKFSAQPMQIKRITLLKSPHVNKKAKESFELRTYKMSLSFSLKRRYKNLMILNSILKNKPKFIKLKIDFKNLKAKKKLKKKIRSSKKKISSKKVRRKSKTFIVNKKKLFIINKKKLCDIDL